MDRARLRPLTIQYFFRTSVKVSFTAVVEVESIINSRPLTYLSASDLEEPLTPSHLINGKCFINLPDDLSYRADLDDGDFAINQEQVRKRIKYSNLVLNHFWNRWRREYLAELRESHRNYSQRCTGVPVMSVGDVVVVHDDALPRGFWRLGLVEELFKGQDEVARGALVRLAPKDGKLTLLRRPIQRLYPLEVHQTNDGDRLRGEGLTNHENLMMVIQSSMRRWAQGLNERRLKIRKRGSELGSRN